MGTKKGQRRKTARRAYDFSTRKEPKTKKIGGIGEFISNFGFKRDGGLRKTKRFGQGPYRNAIHLGSPNTAARGLFRFNRK